MKKFLKIILILLVLGVILMIAGCLNYVKVIVIAPITSELSEFGISTLNAVKMKVNEVNKTGGVLNRSIRLVLLDDKNDPDYAKTTLSKMLSRNSYVGIVGAPFSRIAIGVSEVAESYKVPFVSSVATNPNVTKGKEYAFRACFTDDVQGEAIANFVYGKLNKRSGGVLYDISDPYASYLAEKFKEEFEKLGGKIVAFYPHPFQPTDFRYPIEIMLRNDIDFVFCPDLYRDASMIYNQLRELDFKGPVVFGDGVDAPQILSRVNNIKDAYYVSHHNLEDPKFKEFVERYIATYHVEPNVEAYLAYDAMGILIEAIKKANSTDGDKIAKELKQLTYSGITGEIKFNNTNDPQKPVYFYGFKDSKPVLVYTYIEGK